ncbi:MAG: isochorismatase family protein [Limnobacter sp.]|nr:isochorismatase family protein [Limnobacter sp.]
MLLNKEDCQLLLVDYQQKLMPVILEGKAILENASILARLASKLRVPVFGTEQLPDKLGPLDPQLAGFCKSVLVKSHFSACPEGLVDLLSARPQAGNARSLPRHLKKQEETARKNTVVIGGIESHVCVLQTALDLMDQEFDVWVVTDACSSRTEKNRDAAFDRLAANGAELVTTEMVVFEWLESAEHENFKFALELIK